MTVFVIVVLAVLLAVAVLVIYCLATYCVSRRDESLRIESEVRRAERRLHDLAISRFESMLKAARVGDLDIETRS